ncbi:helicase ARIP4-like isoform X2 [Stigmatopora argus]
MDESHSAPFSSKNGAQGGDLREWQCTPPHPSTSPSGGTPAKAPPSQPTSRPRPGVASQRPAPSSSMTENRKRSSKASHMRRNIRKLLREHQLESVTQSAQQQELQRRRRLRNHRKRDIPTPPLPDHETGDVTKLVSSTSSPPRREMTPGVLCRDPGSTFGVDVGASDAKRTRKAGTRNRSQCDDNAVSGERDLEREPSGMHLNDDFNRPDDQGRVLVNLNHPATEQDIFLSPQLARAVQPHQIGGIRFLYDNMVESLERFGSSSGFGCILAHSMGLGKTLQVISFIDVLFRYTKAHTVLAIVPVNTLQNWLAEFNMWVPDAEALPANSNHGRVRPRNFKVHILNDEHKNTESRAKVVENWAQDGGVLLMGYEMYRLLTLKKNLFSGKRKKSKKNVGPAVINLDEDDRQQKLLKAIERALARPGPDVVICDEGHRIKNCHASTSQALKNIRTKRRVVLTGYPLQNNLMEYWCMVDFVRPDFLGTRQEFSNMFERPILNGQCVDSTPQDTQLMRYRSHVLHSMLEGFVQRRGHDVLKDHLPSKEENVILVRLSPLQRALYTEFMTRFKEAGNTGWLSLNPLKAFCVCCKIWNHPDVLYEALQKENLASDQDLDLDDITSADPKTKALENPTPIGGLSLNQLQDKAHQVITYEWAKDIMCDYEPGILENSPKMVLLFHLIEESVTKGDKILVFSQSLSTLTVIEDFLAKRPVPRSGNTSGKDPLSQNWVRNRNYYRLDGSTTASERERLINQFNDANNTSAFLFLLSTRAGCLGVNLVGANRVVVFDASWNPCHDAQAVCRVYRYGQKKPVHIYRLVCDFTLEKKIYDRQISKQGMSDRVVDDLNPMLNFTRREVESLLHFAEEEPELRQVRPQLQDGTESVLGKALRLFSHLITKQPFPHESLLMDRRELKLSTAEKTEAKKGYEEEKRASVPYTRPSYAHYYPASDQSLTNIPAFSQRNWRPPHTKEKPVVNSGGDQCAPVPAVPRQGSAGSTPTSKDSSASALGGFPVNCLKKAGVFVQKIITTTDMVIPGTNSSTDVKARITAGESIHVIRGSKGTYIRTSDGRIFAIRAANKNQMSDETTASSHDPQASPDEEPTAGVNGCPSPKQQPPVTPESLLRSLSPDSPEIISPLQRHPLTKSKQPERGDGKSVDEACHENGSHRHAKRASLTDAQDLRIPSKRKSPPSSHTDEWPSKRPAAGERSQNFPYSGAYGLPLGFHPALLAGSLGRQLLYAGAGSPFFHPSHPALGDSSLAPELLGLSGVPAPADVSAPASGPPPPFTLPPGLAHPYSQSVASLYRNSTLLGGLPDPMAASFLSRYAPTAGSSSASSPSAHSEVNNGSVSGAPGGSGDHQEAVEVNGL